MVYLSVGNLYAKLIFVYKFIIPAYNIKNDIVCITKYNNKGEIKCKNIEFMYN